ncbi:DnaJ like chaperone protein [Natronocella acetinitrilica]|uniref:DnaJ like chaperone protein n=1 Tax=Natronocella acetinitrilica TaxID=414046 RepID=A0AAE3G0E9_9GAMM|nr:TerB family tellurite resistance protein [Natronocella acetinitrilica]MCP1673022.1 DnaJ like chaperone protein [Natronocella acetinitrilica]
MARPDPELQRLRHLALRVYDWLGRILAGIAAVWLFGLLWLPLGLAVGFAVDRGRRIAAFRLARWNALAADADDRRYILTAAATMGFVAKADGRVSSAEIAAAGEVFDVLELHGLARRQAIRLFGLGKRPGFPAYLLGRHFRRRFGRNEAATSCLIEYLVAVAVADGRLPDQTERALRRVLRGLGRRPEALDTPLRKALFGGGLTLQPIPRSPYLLLGIEPTASDAEISQAYRRLVGRHHPDRLQAQGMSAEDVRAGAERVMAARRAMEAIRRERASA